MLRQATKHRSQQHWLLYGFTGPTGSIQDRRGEATSAHRISWWVILAGVVPADGSTVTYNVLRPLDVVQRGP
jgi:hypothetical protein